MIIGVVHVADMSGTDDAPTRSRTEGAFGFATDDRAPFVLESFTRTAL